MKDAPTRRRWFRRREEQRALTRESLPTSLLGEPLPGDVAPVSIRQAERLPDVRACIGVFARVFALLPLRVWRETPEGLVPVTSGRAVELLTGRPTAWQTPAAWRAFLGSTMARYGEAFVGLVRDDEGQIAELRLLDPPAINVEVEGGEVVYTYGSPEHGVLRLTLNDVVHVLGPNVTQDGLRGTSPITGSPETVALARALLAYALETFTSGGVPPAVVTVAPGPHADEMVENLDAAWHKRGRGRAAVVTGEIDVERLGYSNGESEFLGVARWASELVAETFGLPATVVNEGTGGSMTYENVEATWRRLATLDLRPTLRCVEDALSGCRELFPGQAVARFALGDVPLDAERGWGPGAPSSPEVPSTNGRVTA